MNTTSPWQSNFIQANGLRLHYHRTGGSKPPLVLAHGFSDNGLCYTAVARELESLYDVIMPDARGHGLSDAPDSGYGPFEHADDHAALIQGLGLPHPFIMGHSMGAMTTLALAGRYPELPLAIILEDPPPWWLGAAFFAPYNDDWRAGTHKWLDPLRAKPVEEVIALQRIAEPHWPEADFVPWAESKYQLNLNTLNRASPLDLDLNPLLRRVTCPVLLITSDPALGSIVTPEHAAALQTLIPHLRVAHIPDAGHSIRRDQFKAFMDVVGTFLGELTR